MGTSSVRPSAAANPLASLQNYGQSVWLDFIRASLITGGELKRILDEDGLGGVTSNPAIFAKAIDGSDDYKTSIEEISKDPSIGPKRVYELLAIKDIQGAADILRPVYDRTKAQDGYVSLEVAPDLANNTQGTLEEARRLWQEVNRPNVMIKVPATPEGVPAIRALLSEGINVNVTLLFSKEAYEGVAHAFVDAIEARVNKGLPVDRVASVASFFVSRIDSAVDALLEEKAKTGSGADQARLEGLRGKVAIANAKLAYQSYKRLFSGPRWDALAAKGARLQRPLWASTSTKNPAYSPTLYVDELIGPDTVNTLAPASIEALQRGEGNQRADTVTEDVDGARQVMADLKAAGVDIDDVTDTLEREGVDSFAASFTDAFGTIEKRRAEVTS